MSEIAGTCYPVGPYGRVTTILPTLDFETYSEAGYVFNWYKNKWQIIDGAPKACRSGLEAVGSVVYTEHPTAEVLTLTYDLKDGLGPRVWYPGLPNPQDLLQHIANGGLLEAWNDLFEYYVINNICVRRYGWPRVHHTQLRDAMAKARAFGLPGGLDKAAAAVEAEIPKDSEGATIMRRVSKPRNPTKKDPHLGLRYTRQNSPQDFIKLDSYCSQDVAAESSAVRKMPDLTPEELHACQLDHEINIRGVAIDREGLDNCAYLVRQALAEYTEELKDLTSGVVETPNQLEKLKGWTAGRGFVMHSMDEDAVTAALKHEGCPTDVRRALEIRQLAGSASVKKTFAIERMLGLDGRLHNLYVYHGAHTGRPAGRGPQPTNLPSGGPNVNRCEACGGVYWVKLHHCPYCACDAGFSKEAHEWGPDAVEAALQDISTRNLSFVANRWGSPLAAVSGCLRGLFVGGPGKELICSDYSAIEAVVLAGLAGEEWRLEVFRQKKRIYSVTAEHITGIPMPAEGKHPKDKIGKFGELASGYQGWVGAWLAFGAGDYMTDEEIKDAVLKWRAKSPMIVELWGGQYRENGYRNHTPELYGLEGAAINAVLNPGQVFSYRSISYGVKDSVLYCRLPSGRLLAYQSPQVDRATDRLGRPAWRLSYMGWNSDSTKGPIGWMRRYTYGGKLTENATQAVARDIQTAAMKRINPLYPVVLHVYDELVSEVPIGYGEIAHYEGLMAEPQSWCADWPIRAAGGWRGRRYRK